MGYKNARHFLNGHQLAMESTTSNNTSIRSYNSPSNSEDSIQTTYEVEEIQHTPIEWISLAFLFILVGLLVAVILLIIRVEESNSLFTYLNRTLSQDGTARPLYYM